MLLIKENEVAKYFPNKDIRLISLQDSLDLDILQNFKEKLLDQEDGLIPMEQD